MKSKIRRLTALITNNIGIKLLALIVSLGLWFVVNNITDPVDKVKFNNIAVEIINDEAITDSGKVYEIIDNTGTVNVEVSGKRSVLSYITKDNIKAVADMEELTFMNTIGIEVSSTRNNSDLEFKTNIDSVKLSIEDMKRVQMIISTSTSGEPADGYIVGSVSSSQNIVQLSGPESVIDQIDHVAAVANIDGYSSDISTSVELKLYDADENEITSSSVKMNIATVNVSVTILATKEVPLSFTPADEPADGYIANGEIVSVPETVMLAGKKSVLDTVSKLTISDSALSLADETEDVTAIINIKKYLPTGTQLADSSFNGNVSVTVGIEPLVTRELSIPAKNFAAGFNSNGLPENLEAALSAFEDDEDAVLTVTISGTEAAVEAVDEDSVIGVIDMDKVFESLELDEWSEGSYTGEVVFNFKLPEDVTVETDTAYTLTVELREIQDDEGDDGSDDE
ncbi:MAG: hypothetical protein LUE96_04515 [Lachnospiraceae bacterium]|nr:hypothetical protein [Lachnospiraceae bacterium]